MTDKRDAGKPRHSLLPMGFVGELIAVLEFGAIKYDVDKWQAVSEPRTRYYNALHRHAAAWWDGEQLDPESGKHHLAHAAACCAFLIWFDTQESAR